MSETILLVDDDAGVRDVVAFTLRREGYEVDEERDGESALESGRSGRYTLDVLVCDVMLPGTLRRGCLPDRCGPRVTCRSSC